MIASLRGTLTEQTATSCVIEAGGVGYLVHLSSHTATALPERGEMVFLLTRQVVREDSVQLYGFSEREELKLFDLLIAVSGVGPKLALAVLSGMKPHALVRAIREEQVGALTTVPGVGRKTAERLVVELRDKLEAPPYAAKESGVLPGAQRLEDAVAALTRLGYTPSQAQEAVRHVARSASDLSLEDIVRRALATLGRATAASR